MQECTAVVALVLGAKVLSDGQPSALLRHRAEHAAKLWHEGAVTAIVASGGALRGKPSEARVIAEICRARGVPEPVLHLEEEATTTEENLLLSKPLLDRLGTGTLVIVTDRPHSYRAAMVARRQGWTVRRDCPDIPWSRARAKAWRNEAVAFLWYWGQGRGRPR